MQVKKNSHTVLIVIVSPYDLLIPNIRGCKLTPRVDCYNTILCFLFRIGKATVTSSHSCWIHFLVAGIPRAIMAVHHCTLLVRANTHRHTQHVRIHIHLQMHAHTDTHMLYTSIILISTPSALHGRLEAVQLLLDQCDFKLDSPDSSGVTPLMDAARGNHKEVVLCLITNGKV